MKGVELYPNGGRAFRRGGGGGRRGGGRRGRVLGFSVASRRRLQAALLSRLDPAAAGESRLWWITLTGRTGLTAEFKAVFRAAVERVRRRFPAGWGLVWRLEYQARGAPHFHILLQAETAALAFSVCKCLLVSWVSIAGERLGAVWQAQNAKLCRNVASLAIYISDVSKVQQSACPSDEAPGRYWGRIGYFFFLVVPVVVLGRSAYFEFLRIIRKLRRARYRCNRRRAWRGRGGFTEFWSLLTFRCVLDSLVAIGA